MNLDAIPDELKARKQWVVWKSIVSDGKVTKPPYNPNNPVYQASVTDSSSWGSYDDAVRAFQSNSSILSGIGFVFTSEDDYFGIDLDDESKVAPEFLPARKQLVTQLIENLDTYTEMSPSGQGLHMIGRGRLPIAGHRSTKLQFEVYQEERYFTITGDVFGDRNRITDQQEFLNELAITILQQRDRIDAGVTDTDIHRRLDLTDEEVIRLATNYHPNFAPRFNAQTGCLPGEWSDTFMAIVGLIERFTGSVAQVQRIVLNSPMVLQAPNSAANETRLDKAKRNFAHVLSRVRQNNSGLLAFAEHGRQQWEKVQKAKAERAQAIADEILRQAEETFSKNGVNLLKAFPIEPQYLQLTPPPGIVGRFCEATAAACYNPYLKFAIPATIATLTGIVGRAYKLPSGNGLNVNFILAAATSAGKTQTMRAWEHFLYRAAKQIGNTITGPTRIRLIKAAASSIQGIFPDFMENPSAVWFISECASQLAQMSAPKSTTDGQLRDAYNDLYDASQMGSIFSPPRSTANRKAELTPIENLSVSTYWTTTTVKFDVFSDDAQDGFLSRVIIIRHAGSAGEAIPEWDLESHLPDDLHQALINRLAAAKQFDETFAMSAQDGARLITVVSTAEVEGMAWAFRQISERIKNASLDGSMPMAYTAVSRLPVTALRIAGMLAVMENPYTPAVTPEQFQWAFGYLLQNVTALLSDMDRGELGATMSKDMDVVIREIKRGLKKSKAGGVKKGELVHALRFLKPFKDDRAPGDAVRRTLTEMQGLGMIVEAMPPSATPGRPVTLVCPTDDPIWAAS